MTQEIKNAFTLNSCEKMQVLGKIREKLFKSSQNEFFKNSNRSSRPSSAARDKNKEDVNSKRKDSKLLTSPYMQQLFVDKNPSFRLKHYHNGSKVAKCRSFAILDS